MGLTVFRSLFTNPTLRTKLLWVLGLLAVYRLLVFVPVPFVNIDALMAMINASASQQ